MINNKKKIGVNLQNLVIGATKYLGFVQSSVRVIQKSADFVCLFQVASEEIKSLHIADTHHTNIKTYINEYVHKRASLSAISCMYSGSQLVRTERQQIQHRERNWLWAVKI